MFGFIRRFFKKRRELKKYQYGDIIWCDIKKYGDKFNFSEGHQKRPFLFVNYEKGIIYGYTLTHNDNLNSLSYVMQFKPFERVVLSCLFELRAKTYIEYFRKMPDDDLSRISKIIYNMHTNDKIRENILKHIIIDKNDIVLYQNDKYLVYAANSDSYTLYKITRNQNDLYVKNEKDDYYISTTPTIVKDNDSLIYVDTFKIDVAKDFNYLRLKKKKESTAKDNICPLKRGDVVKLKNRLVVLLEVDGDKITYTKLMSPDYIVKTTKYMGQAAINSVPEYKIKSLEHQIKKLEELGIINASS